MNREEEYICIKKLELKRLYQQILDYQEIISDLRIKCLLLESKQKLEAKVNDPKTHQ